MTLHELYLAESILKGVANSLPNDTTPEEVASIRIRVGRLDAVVPDNLTYLFDVLKSEFRMNNAKLHIDVENIVIKCRTCSEESTLEEPLFYCKSCNSNLVDILRGRGLTILEALIFDNTEIT